MADLTFLHYFQMEPTHLITESSALRPFGEELLGVRFRAKSGGRPFLATTNPKLSVDAGVSASASGATKTERCREYKGRSGLNQ